MQPANRHPFAQPQPEPEADLHDDEAPAPAANPLNKLIVVAVLTLVVVFGWQAFGPKSALAGWSHDWDAAAEQARSTGKPPLVLFTADWCPPCKTLKGELGRSDVSKYLKDNYTLVVVDLTDRGGPNNARAKEYGVQGIPTLILYSAAGREQARTFGMDGDALMRWLQNGGRF